jgi:hypothetical protein
VIAALLANTKAVQLNRDVKDVWELRSVNGESDNAQVQKAFGDHATASANARPAMRSWVELDEQRDVKDVWELRSVNGEADNASVQQAFGNHATAQANARPAMRSWVNLDNEIWVDELVQYPEPQMGAVCGGANGSKMQDCRVSRWHDQN